MRIGATNVAAVNKVAVGRNVPCLNYRAALIIARWLVLLFCAARFSLFAPRDLPQSQGAIQHRHRVLKEVSLEQAELQRMVGLSAWKGKPTVRRRTL